MSNQNLPKPEYVKNMKLIGYSDQGGRPDGVQLMVNKGHAFIGHMFSKGFSIIDVRDPRNPKPVNYVAAPDNTWNIHLQTHDDLLLVINAKDMFASEEFKDESQYYKGALGKKVGTADAEKSRARDWTAGLSVYDIANPAAAASDRLHARRGWRYSPTVVYRWTLGLCVGSARRIHRLYLHDYRHG